MKKKTTRILCLLLSVMLLPVMAGCGGSNEGGDDLSFTWWIPDTDGRGTFYTDYEENVAVQWVNNQYWDVESGGLGDENHGKKIDFSFQAPIKGAERDNFNAMISTGDYPEIVDLSYSTSPYELYQSGHLMEITEYVEQYCPNYIAVLEAHPQMKPFTTVTDEDGNVHYYAIYNIGDSAKIAWQGFMYRRDWVVKYAEPSEYVWDWDSAEVKSNGHPDVTPLSAAVASGNLNGWKKNEVTKFEKSEGSDPNNDYTDNVIFPSGKADPYTISDWEWMFEAFTRALEAEGLSSDSNAYCYAPFYPGYLETGELVSSFGGGGPIWYLDSDGNAAFGGTNENFKVYVECMNTWNENGWLDSKFESRSSDIFYQINANGYSRGLVGLWQGGIGDAGVAIRTTCTNPDAQKDAMVFGCSLPVNDVYGSDAQKFNIPDMLYQDSQLSVPTGFTTKCEGKDMATLFTYINYMFSEEGSKVSSFGLSEEQYKSMTFEPDLYAETGITSAYTVETVDGMDHYTLSVDASLEVANAIKNIRMATHLFWEGGNGSTYTLDRGYSGVKQHAIEQWGLYAATAAIRDYNGLLTPEDMATYNKTRNYVTDHMNQTVPTLIKNGLDGWDDYCAKLEKYNPDKVTEIYQSYMN